MDLNADEFLFGLRFLHIVPRITTLITCSYSIFVCGCASKTFSAKQARMLLKSLVIIGALTGLFLGVIGTSVPWLFPRAFSPDVEIIKEVILLFH